MGATDCTNKILTFTDQEEVGGQTFNKFPEDDAEVAQFWSEAWFEMVKDLAAPPIAAPPDASKATFASTMQALVAVPNGGLAAMDAAAVAAFPLLAASIAPNLIAAPPPAPFLTILTANMTPFLIESLTGPGPVPPAAAAAWAASLSQWIATAMWTPPGPPAPAPFATT